MPCGSPKAMHPGPWSGWPEAQDVLKEPASLMEQTTIKLMMVYAPTAPAVYLPYLEQDGSLLSRRLVPGVVL